MHALRFPLTRRDAAAALACALAATSAPPAGAAAPPRKTLAVLGMTLEPPGLDPTVAAASAIGEVVLYNVFETLTRIGSDGSVGPLLARSWTSTPDAKTWAFRLQPGVKFHNGEAFDAGTVKFAFERAAAAGSPNKDRAVYANIFNIAITDPLSLVITLKNPNPDFAFQLGQATAVIVEPKSAQGNDASPVGTGPFRIERWAKGSSLTLSRWDDHRDAARVALQRATFRFISDAAAQVAALLAGDVDAFPRVSAARSLSQFADARRFQVLVGSSRTKVILAINNARKPLDDVRVRRALAHAIDRKALIDGAADGYGLPIGSYYPTNAPGYVDLTQAYPFDPERARALLRQAGVALPLELSLKLPPTPYARTGGEIVQAQLAKAGINARIENVEWAQWLAGVYGQKAYDLTLIAHVEPLDFGNFARPNYYWNYESTAFNELWARINRTADVKRRLQLLGQAQRLVTDDAVAVYLYQPGFITVAKAGLTGLWKDSPVLVNDLAALAWH